MPAPIVLRDLIPPPKKAGESPKIATRSDMRDGARGLGGGGGGNTPPAEGVLLQESFDSWPDWTSAMHSDDRSHYASTHNVPPGVYAIRQDPVWAPSVGHPDRHESVEILASHSAKARNGTGKCWLSWRDWADPVWEFNPGTVTQGQYVVVRHRASEVVGETKTTTLTVAGQTYTFSSTPSNSPTHSNPSRSSVQSSFQNANGCVPGDLVESGTIQVPTGGSISISEGSDYIVSSNASSWGDWKRWNSESMTAWYFPGGSPQLYVEYYIAFDENWTERGSSKMFRITSWNPQDDFFGFGGGRANGPVFFYDYQGYPSGVRNRLAFRTGTWGSNPYLMPANYISGLSPNRDLSSGDVSLDWTSEVIGNLPDKLNGGFLPKTFATPVSHAQLFGPPGSFTKMAFWVKLNSAPGVMDGEFKQWVDDVPICSADVIWVPEDRPMENWNVVAIGGNDYTEGVHTNAERHEEWYAIDDLLVQTTIPEHLL